jgi:hypothetical protein
MSCGIFLASAGSILGLRERKGKRNKINSPTQCSGEKGAMAWDGLEVLKIDGLLDWLDGIPPLFTLLGEHVSFVLLQ